MWGFHKRAELCAPFDGTIVALDGVNDEAFSSGLLGSGFACVPAPDATTLDVCSPVAGTVVTVFKTLHAIGIKSDEGLDVLIHIGLETVEMKGEGFTALVSKGDHVEAGTALIRVDVEHVRASGRDPITPVVLPKRAQVADLKVSPGPCRVARPTAKVTLS